MTPAETTPTAAEEHAVGLTGTTDDGLVSGASAPPLRRLHPLTPFFRSWRVIGAATALVLGVFRDDLDQLKWVWDALQGNLRLSLLTQAAAITVGVAALALAGAWLSWRATGFAIMVDRAGGPGTLLFHRGVLAKRRSQVRLNRVQSVDVNRPFIPRLCGLAAVQLDMAAGNEASVDLAYLRLDEATALREEILRHTSTSGSRAADEVDDASIDGRGEDLSTQARPDVLIAQVSTEQVVKSNLLDGISAWIAFVVWVIALVVAGSLMGGEAFLAALSGFIPVTIAIIAQLRRQVASMLRDADFKLFRTDNGVRISSGLMSTVNRTVDSDRIQAVRLVEPFWWRRFGWARVKLDIAGGSSDFSDGASLIPVANRAQALALIEAVTGASLGALDYVGVGKGARPLDPLGWRFLDVALMDSGAVTRAGRWRRSTSYVPYARVQSVSARQGLVQRRLGLATVFLDLPTGSQRWKAQHRAVSDAAALVGELAGQARVHRLRG